MGWDVRFLQTINASSNSSLRKISTWDNEGDRAVVVEDDGSDDDIKVDETLEEYNDEPIIENDSEDNNTITDCDIVQSDDEEE